MSIKLEITKRPDELYLSGKDIGEVVKAYIEQATGRKCLKHAFKTPGGSYVSDNELASITTFSDEETIGALPAPLDTAFVGGCYPTHYCTICNAMWRQWRDGSWNLRSRQAGPCCNNQHGSHIVEMDTCEPGVGINQ